MLSNYGLDDEEALLDALTRQRMLAQRDVPTGTVGPSPLPSEETPDIPTVDMNSLPSVTPLPPRVDLTAARLADREQTQRRGFESAAKQAIGGLTLTAPVDVVTPEGTAEKQALADESRTRADAMEQRRAEMMDRQLALSALLKPKPKAKTPEELAAVTLRANAAAKNAETYATRTANDATIARERLAAQTAARAAAAEAARRKAKEKKEAGEGQRSFKSSMELRKEFDALPEVKDFKNVDVAFRKIQKAADSVSAAGDLSLIFAYMKMLDPGSTVREGEFASAANAGGVDDRVRSAYNNVVSGQRLAPAQRADFLGQARGVHEAQKSRYQESVDLYRSLASKADLDPDDITGAPRQASGPDNSPPPADVVMMIGPDGEELPISSVKAPLFEKRGYKRK